MPNVEIQEMKKFHVPMVA